MDWELYPSSRDLRAIRAVKAAVRAVAPSDVMLLALQSRRVRSEVGKYDLHYLALFRLFY